MFKLDFSNTPHWFEEELRYKINHCLLINEYRPYKCLQPGDRFLAYMDVGLIYVLILLQIENLYTTADYETYFVDILEEFYNNNLMLSIPIQIYEDEVIVIREDFIIVATKKIVDRSTIESLSEAFLTTQDRRSN